MVAYEKFQLLPEMRISPTVHQMYVTDQMVETRLQAAEI